MAIAVKIIGIVFVFIAVIYLLKPDILKHLMEFFKKGRRLYFAGLLRFVLAVVFLLGANDCRIPWVIITLGILFIISGLLVFTLGLERLKAMLEWYQKQPSILLRVIALIALGVGAVIIYSA